MENGSSYSENGNGKYGNTFLTNNKKLNLFKKQVINQLQKDLNILILIYHSILTKHLSLKKNSYIRV